MKTFGFLSNALVLLSYIQLKSCFADQDKKLIRRSQHQWAPLFTMCHHACDCYGYPGKPVCCEKRGPDKHKKCYMCCFKHGKKCVHPKDCCSQKCEDEICVPNPDTQTPVGLCPILFPGDYLTSPLKGPPFAPFPYYVQPKLTGPLRWIEFCPIPLINLKAPEGTGKTIDAEDEKTLSSLNFPPPGPDPVLMYLVKGQCDIDQGWRVIQGGILQKHWHWAKKCYKIKIIDYSQLKVPHPHVDYTKYHVVFFWKWGKTIWPLWLPELDLDKDLRMFAKCNEAWPYSHPHP